MILIIMEMNLVSGDIDNYEADFWIVVILIIFVVNFGWW